MESRAERYARYSGKNFAALLLAICAPAALLFVRLLFGVIAGDTRITPSQSVVFLRLSYVALALFFLVQAAAALYLQRHLSPARRPLSRLLQYCFSFVLGLLFSVVGAVVLEAFGLNLFLRVAGR